MMRKASPGRRNDVTLCSMLDKIADRAARKSFWGSIPDTGDGHNQSRAQGGAILPKRQYELP